MELMSKEFINNYLPWSRASEGCLEFGSFLAKMQSPRACCCFISRRVCRPVVSGPVETWYESDPARLHETKSSIGNK